MRGCTRCGATYATGVLFCPRDGATTVELTGSAPASFVRAATTAPPRPSPPPAATVPPAAPRGPPDPFLGKMVGNFRLTRRLGAGGMGAVYEAVHPIVGNRVAVKLLGGSLALDRDLVDRFFSEARTLNQVAHDNIVKVVDLGVHPEGFYYCVMELLDGETLATQLARGRLELARGLGLLVQCCDALAAAHEKGIVHRDLKPANIMLVRHPATGLEQVKLVDFGIAKLHASPQAAATVTGTVIGTPAYMSPEQASGRVGDIDPRSDLYALGLVAYEMLTGHHPFEGRAVGELIVAQITETPPPPSRVFDLPPRIDEVVMRLLRKRREERFPSAAAVGQELRAGLEALRAPPPPVLAPVAAPKAPAASPVATPLPARPETPRSLDRRSDRPPVTPPPQLLPAFEAAAPVTQASTAAASTPPASLQVFIPRPSAPGLPVLSLPERTSGVRLANRKLPRPKADRPVVRPLFLLALVLVGAIAGAAMVGALDAEPYVAKIARALGFGEAPPKIALAVPPGADGVPMAFAASPLLDRCRPGFDELRAWKPPTTLETLEPALARRLALYDQLTACLAAVKGKLPPDRLWAPTFLHGTAALDLANALDALPPALRRRAREYRDVHQSMLYGAERFAYEAGARLSDAKQTAPAGQQGAIDKKLIDVDLIKQRAGRSAANGG